MSLIIYTPLEKSHYLGSKLFALLVEEKHLVIYPSTLLPFSFLSCVTYTTFLVLLSMAFFSSQQPPIPRFRICFDRIDIPELGSTARCFSSYVHIFGQIVRLTWIIYNLCLKHFVLGSFTILATLCDQFHDGP